MHMKRNKTPVEFVSVGIRSITMHRMNFLIFFSIVIVIYGLANYYVYIRGLQALPAKPVWYIVLFWFIAASYVVGRFSERLYPGGISSILVWIGSFWLAALLFFFLLVVLLDFARLANKLLNFLPAQESLAYTRLKLGLFWSGIILVGGLVGAGFVNARNPMINTLEITIDKPANGMQRLEAIVMSDIHLGTIIGPAYLAKIIRKVNALKPDIIILPGDILDEDLGPVIRQNTGEVLKQLQAPLGVFGVMGNHEYIGGGAQAYNYLKDHGIIMLRDSVYFVNESFIIAGREDRDKSRFTGIERLSLDSLLQNADFSYPVILVDHQPYYLEQAAELGVDLQLSGHTHAGQIWPLSYLINAIYTLSHGYGQIGNMHAYVSNGVGTWGPPVRIGNKPEILRLIINFRE
jgi:uncharacterized protein